jgi:hypothetical protein
LTRASIILRKSFVEEMDCRVKPGNDERGKRPATTEADGLRAPHAVIRR